MKVTFIALPWIFKNPELQSHEGYSQNLGIGYLASWVEKHGHMVFAIDIFAEGADTTHEVVLGRKNHYIIGLSPEETVTKIPEDSDIIGITCSFNSQAFLIEKYASAIKKCYPDRRVVLGGTYATSFPQEALTDHIDIVVRGEGEIPLLNLLSGKPLEDIKGILYRSEGKVMDNALAPLVENMDDLPFPARNLLPMEKYFERSQRGEEKSARSISITTTRGCPFRCEFCSLHNLENNYAKQWRARTPENVMAEIDSLKEQYGDVSFQFEDDNIMVDRNRAKELFRQLRGRKVKWSIHSGVMINLLDEETIKLMKESGCEQLNIALESGNKKVIKAMNKPMNLEKAEEVVRLCVKYRVNVLAFLIVGYPGETKETFKETLKVLKKLRGFGLKRIAPFIINAHRGTVLFEKCKEKGYLRNIEEGAYSQSDMVCIETEDFKESDVWEWMDQVVRIQNPVRWMTKRILKKLLPQSFYSRAILIYRGLHDLI